MKSLSFRSIRESLLILLITALLIVQLSLLLAPTANSSRPLRSNHENGIGVLQLIEDCDGMTC